MANVTINDLTARTSLAATDVFEVDNTSSADASEKATFALAGGLVATTGSDADTIMAVGTLYRVDMSAWATATRTYRLPSTAQVGERIGVYITAGNASHELAIRTVAASNDTINGTDYDSADWSKLFITGEIVIFRCVVADTDWVVEYDGRIPCHFAAHLTADVTGETAFTWTDAGFNDDSTNGYDVGDVYDASTDERLEVRRDGYWEFHMAALSVNAVGDQDYFGGRILDGNSNILGVTVFRISASGSSIAVIPIVGRNSLLSDGDTVKGQFTSSEGSRGLDDNRTAGVFQGRSFLTGFEILKR